MIKDQLPRLLALRKLSDEAQTAAARARLDYEQFAADLAVSWRDTIDNDKSATCIIDKTAITLRGAHHPAATSFPFSYSEAYDE